MSGAMDMSFNKFRITEVCQIDTGTISKVIGYIGYIK
jgi:hypothetical protein